jgi:hypothetical protein
MIKKKKPVAARGKTTKKEAVKRSMKKAMTGSVTGMGGAGLMAMARKIKKDGKISPKDLMRMKAAMGKKTGGEMTREELKKLFDRVPKRGLKSPSGQKPVLDSKGNPVKNLFQKDDGPKRGMQRPRMPRRGLKSLPPRVVRKRILGRKIK